ncbi:MAG: hypothetical protein XXXJIFNMEKO3_02753 [Candidatus Erwinia impunctatus]|nr:hypothetical protein XXXJIFNMEKO_02753 [Culicoides impunctatus]
MNRKGMSSGIPFFCTGLDVTHQPLFSTGNNDAEQTLIVALLAILVRIAGIPSADDCR